MKELDIQRLDAREQRVLDLSFRHSLNDNGVRNIVLSTLVVLMAIIVFSVLGFGAMASTGMALLILAISTVEKIFFAREVFDYKALVRKLTHRVEQLEGTKLTPEGAHPAETAKQQALIQNSGSARVEGSKVPRPSSVHSESSPSK